MASGADDGDGPAATSPSSSSIEMIGRLSVMRSSPRGTPSSDSTPVSTCIALASMIAAGRVSRRGRPARALGAVGAVGAAASGTPDATDAPPGTAAAASAACSASAWAMVSRLRLHTCSWSDSTISPM